MTHHFDDNTPIKQLLKMKCEFEPLNNFKVKTNTVKKGSLVKNLGSDLSFKEKNDSHNNVILINFKN